MKNKGDKIMYKVLFNMRGIPVIIGNYPTISLAMSAAYFNKQYIGAESLTVFYENKLISYIQMEG